MNKIHRERENIALAPRPVHPRAMRLHGLFGLPFLRQHMIMDDRWTVDSLKDEFKKMSDLLARRFLFKRLEFNANSKLYNRKNHQFRRHCREGRAKLHMSLYGESAHNVRNVLINHKDMQRLYQKMPIQLAVDNINQRTFVLRKERDRLRFRLDQLKETYRSKLLERANLENRIIYENKFILEEDTKSREFLKKIENSNVRIRANKTINVAYKKMIQVLRHDAIFYEPILRSLTKDIEDQTNFIKHVLHLGIPAISKFKELSDQYREMEELVRKNIQTKLQYVVTLKEKIRDESIIPNRNTAAEIITASNRYVRETKSMMVLKYQLENVESVIKAVKFATLCSRAKEIFPRMKTQDDNNNKLNKMIANDTLGHLTLEIKMERARVLEGVLINNLSEEEIMRMDRVTALQTALDYEHKFQGDTIKYLKNRADTYVLLRFTLWNLSEILRHVDRVPKIPRTNYPNSYLKLPLLKFEMFTMRSYPPEIYEEDLSTILHLVKRKIKKIMQAYTTELTATQITKNTLEYNDIFTNGMGMEDPSEDPNQALDEHEDLIAEGKTYNVLTRKQIKAQSAKIVEAYSKRED